MTFYPKAGDIITFRSKTGNAAVVTFTDICGNWRYRGGVGLGVVGRGGLRRGGRRRRRRRSRSRSRRRLGDVGGRVGPLRWSRAAALLRLHGQHAEHGQAGGRPEQPAAAAGARARRGLPAPPARNARPGDPHGFRRPSPPWPTRKQPSMTQSKNG